MPLQSKEDWLQQAKPFSLAGQVFVNVASGTTIDAVKNLVKAVPARVRGDFASDVNVIVDLLNAGATQVAVPLETFTAHAQDFQDVRSVSFSRASPSSPFLLCPSSFPTTTTPTLFIHTHTLLYPTCRLSGSIRPPRADCVIAGRHPKLRLAVLQLLGAAAVLSC